MRFILANKDELVGEWVRKHIPRFEFSSPYTAIGLMNEAGIILAGVVYENYTNYDVHVHIAAIQGKRWMSKRWLGEVFRYPFEQLKVQRITALVPASNAESEEFTRHLGFKKEGRVREMLGDDDLLVYGMLKRECRFLDIGRFHGLTHKFDRRTETALL